MDVIEGSELQVADAVYAYQLDGKGASRRSSRMTRSPATRRAGCISIMRTRPAPNG